MKIISLIIGAILVLSLVSALDPDGKFNTLTIKYSANNYTLDKTNTLYLNYKANVPMFDSSKTNTLTINYKVNTSSIRDGNKPAKTNNFTVLRSEILLMTGWNLISLPMKNNDIGTDRNISVVAGWNLPGYVGNTKVYIRNIKFSNATGTYNNAFDIGMISNISIQRILPNGTRVWLMGVANQSQQSKAPTGSYPYQGITEFIKPGEGYWVYANQSGNLTLPGVGGTIAGQTYSYNKLRFSNGSLELNYTQASSSPYNWVDLIFQYYGEFCNGEDPCYYGFKYIQYEESQDYSEYDSNLTIGKRTISSNEGIFIRSLVDNLTLIRQN